MGKAGYNDAVDGIKELSDLSEALFADDAKFIQNSPKGVQENVKKLVLEAYRKGIRRPDHRVKSI